MHDLSSLARAVLRALTMTPGGAPEFDVLLVRAVLGVNEPIATGFLAELLQSGAIVERQSTGHHARWYRITDPAVITRDGVGADTAALESVIEWLVQLAMDANHARDPHSRMLAPSGGPAEVARFGTPADAMVWFEPHLPGLVELVAALLAAKSYERCISLAEAVFGLAGHGGHQHEQLEVASLGLKANASWFYGPSYATSGASVERRTRFCVVAARLNLMHAEVENHLHGPARALQAIDDAEERAREIGDEGVLAAVHRRRAITHHAAGDLAEAESAARLALELDEASGDPRRTYLCWRRLGNIQTSRGLFDEADGAFATAGQGAESAGHQIPLARIETDWGASLVAAGRFEEAIPKLTTALTRLTREEAGSQLYLAAVLRNRALARRALNEAAGAEQDYRQAVEHFRRGRHERAAQELESLWS